MKRKKDILLDLLPPCIILLYLTVIFRITDLDVTIQKLFFVQEKGWVYKNLQPWRFLYDYGPLPAIMLTVVALVVLIVSFRLHSIVSYRRMALFFVLLMIIGPGLVVNVMFKGYWGRPRPRSVEKFSGSESFLYVWEKGVAGKGASFPSGHASMGFFLLSPYFVVRKFSRKRALIILASGLSWGTLIGIARMIQGGHFASDVVWAGGFVYLCGVGLYYFMRLDHEVLSENTRPEVSYFGYD